MVAVCDHESQDAGVVLSNPVERLLLAKAAVGLPAAVGNATRGFESFPLRHKQAVFSPFIPWPGGEASEGFLSRRNETIHSCMH